MSLSLDNCVHCACETHLPTISDPVRAIALLDRGELGCWNCEDQAEAEGDQADGHTRCVQLLDGDGKVLWDGRCQKE